MWEQTDSSPWRNNRIYIKDWKFTYDYTDDWKPIIQSSKVLTWLHHLVVTRKDKQCNLYIDNNLDTTWTFEDAYSDTLKFEIWDNYNWWSNTWYFDWTLSIINIYNRVLSDYEIQTLYLEWLQKLTPARNTYPKLFDKLIWY